MLGITDRPAKIYVKHQGGPEHMSLRLGKPSTAELCCRLQVLRYAHWAATTALIVYLVSRLTDFTARRTTTVCVAQAGVILFGFLGFLSKPSHQCEHPIE